MAKKKERHIAGDITYDDLVEYVGGGAIVMNAIAQAMEDSGNPGLDDSDLWWRTIANLHKIAFMLALRGGR
jgi:hypothetical protein